MVGIIVAMLTVSHLKCYINPNSSATDSVVSMDSGWELKINDEVLKDVNLNDYHLRIMAKKGDEIILFGKLPSNMPKHPMLVFETAHSYITAYIDGVLTYTYGRELFRESKMLGYGFHKILLEQSDINKDIKIVINVAENNAFSGFETPFIASSAEYGRDILKLNAIKNIISIIFIFFGFSVFVAQIIYLVRGVYIKRLVSLSLFSVSMGIWQLSTTGFLSYFFCDFNIESYLGYLFLYITLPAAAGYLAPQVRYESRFRWLLFVFMKMLLGMFCVLTFILHMLNIVHISSFLSVFHILAGMSTILVLTIFLVDLYNNNVKSSKVAFGFELMCIISIIDLVLYNLGTYSNLIDDKNYSSVSHFGVLIFLVSLVLDFMEISYNKLYLKLEEEALKKIAYTDILTGVSNRRKAEELMDRIDEDNKEYVLVVFDINDVKRVNDTFGHSEGDEYIKSFATIIRKVFGAYGICARMGGDEFYVIIADVNSFNQSVEKLLKKVDLMIDEVNEEHPKWKMSVSSGHISREEARNLTIREAAVKADENMYARKRAMKALQ